MASEDIDGPQGRDSGPQGISRAVLERAETLENELAEARVALRRYEKGRAKATAGEIEAARQGVMNQLSYRFGNELQKALRNPLRLVILPISLVRQWRDFRKSKTSGQPDETVESNRHDSAEASVSDMISHDVAREMSVEALAGIGVKKLRSLLRDFTGLGEVDIQVRLAEALWLREKSVHTGIALRLKRGQLDELDPEWLPLLPERPLQDSDPNTVLHLFKTIYPLESTGGAVRNWSIVTEQRKAELRPVVAVSPARLPQNITEANGGRDGRFSVEREGVPIHFCHLATLDRKRIPHDVMVTFETNILGDLCERERVSLIHAASGFRGYENALKGLALARSHNLPFVYEVRSFHEHTWTAHFDGIEDTEMTQRRMAQENRCMKAADAVVTISEAMAKQLEQRGIERDRIFIVPNSVERHFLEDVDPDSVEVFKREYGLSGKTVIGYISNISRREGHEVLCEAMAQLVGDRPDVHLLLVGDGGHRESIEARVDELGITDSVTFTGQIDHSRITAAYAAIDLFVVPRLPDYASDYVTPMKPIEAMAMRRPIIMSDRPVSRELLGEEERGLYFKTGDAGDLARVIGGALADVDGSARRVAAARQWVEETRTWADNVALYEPVYAFARDRHDANGSAK
ncbi:glycosyltransferase family 4 protein [Parasphingopyxis sp.]|uniref:glycosyltransferase family 4 protein n=1 Tax=Parasphingopyxis sp. TaxID=1920299 RepID=UPI00262F7AA0|nr:glycosyltransferase family 4 protein [Parasphingopyxis sp.]